MTTPPIRRWRPEGEPKATCVIVHGLAEHSRRYEHVGQRLADGGYLAYAFDLRGHGEAEGWPGKVTGADDWLDDLAAVHAQARAEGRGPLFVISHSLGTLVTITYLGERGRQGVAGVVFSGNALIPGSALVEALAADVVVIPPESLCRDPEVVRDYKDDPSIFGDRIPDETRAAGLALLQRAHETVGKLSLPALFLHGTADVLCDVSGVAFAMERIGGGDLTQRTYDGMYHEVFNELEKERVLDDMVEWLDAHIKR
jgi:acylglycerol lipase